MGTSLALKGDRVLRGLTGVLAGGLVVLLVGLGVAWFAGNRIAIPVPTPAMLVWHAVAAVAAVLAQRFADRRAGTAVGILGALAVAGITTAVLTTQWLA